MANKMKYALSSFIGESITGLPSPIFFDPHYPIYLNRPPVTLITGSPGSGKTFLAEILVGQSSVMDKLTFVIDPKGDFLALKNLERFGEINKTNVWSIFTNEDTQEISKENEGMLNPLTFFPDKNDNVALTISVLDSLAKEITPKQSNKLMPIVQDVVESKTPSLLKVINLLKRNQDDEIRNLGVELDVIANMGISKLLISNQNNENPFNQSNGLMIVSLLGLDLPDSETAEKDYQIKQKVSTVIMRLLTQLVLEAMKNQPKKILKTLVIDEAWVVFGNKSGKSLIDQAALLGRSLNMATILATQSPRHISVNNASGGSTLDTTISTRFVFRNDSDQDNIINRRALRLPENDGWEEIFPKFSTGQCMFKDCNNQLAIIHIMTSNEWEEAFNTNPSASLQNNKT